MQYFSTTEALEPVSGDAYTQNMKMAEVIAAAMALTPEERSHVADVLSDVDEADTAAVDSMWAAVAARRAEELSNSVVTGLSREDLSTFLAERRASRNA